MEDVLLFQAVPNWDVSWDFSLIVANGRDCYSDRTALA